MIPKAALEKAIEGGWKYKSSDRYSREEAIAVLMTLWEGTALDSSFWQALGRALGWNEDDSIMQARHFCYLVLTGGDTGKFWDELLK